MSSKDATQKMQFLGAIKKWPAWTFRAKTQKWRENSADSAATSKICPNPNVLAYSKSP